MTIWYGYANSLSFPFKITIENHYNYIKPFLRSVPTIRHCFNDFDRQWKQLYLTSRLGLLPGRPPFQIGGCHSEPSRNISYLQKSHQAKASLTSCNTCKSDRAKASLTYNHQADLEGPRATKRTFLPTGLDRSCNMDGPLREGALAYFLCGQPLVVERSLTK